MAELLSILRFALFRAEGRGPGAKGNVSAETTIYNVAKPHRNFAFCILH